MKNTNKKRGFTLIELVVVVAVIAILTAVLVPTFVGVINKANASADQTAVRSMNTALAADGVVEPTDIFELYDVLARAGYKAKDYSPLARDRFFFWDPSSNQIVYADNQYNVLFPKGAEAEVDKNTWVSLNGKIYTDNVDVKDLVDDEDNTVAKVTSAAELVALAEAISAGKLSVKNVTTITLAAGNYNLMGAELVIANNNNAKGKVLDRNLTIDGNGAVLSNIVNTDAARENATNASGDNTREYGAAIIPQVSGAKVEIKNVTVSNAFFGNDVVTGAAAFVGLVGDGATVSFVNADVKNVEVRGLYKVGAFVGQVHGGALALDADSVVSDTDIIVYGGLAGKVFGDALNITPVVVAANVGANVKVTLDEVAAVKYVTVGDMKYAQDLSVVDGAIVPSATVAGEYYATVAEYGFVGTYGNNPDLGDGVLNKYNATPFTPAAE